MSDVGLGESKERSDELRIEYWPIERLIPSARNARTHSASQIAEIAGSIRAFGFTNPLLVGEGADIVAGHGRLAAARLLGLAEVPVIPLRGLSEVERRMLMLADNRIALNAGWNLEMLRLELTDLSKLGADLKGLGFNEHELERALGGSVGLVPEDAVPELTEAGVSKTGDIWLLGPHRIGCGDSTDAAFVSSVMGDGLPNLMVTDPPYGVEYDPAWRHRRGLNHSAKKNKIRNDEVADGRRLGICSRAKSPTSGMGLCVQRLSPKVSSRRASPSVLKSSGPRNDW